MSLSDILNKTKLSLEQNNKNKSENETLPHEQNITKSKKEEILSWGLSVEKYESSKEYDDYDYCKEKCLGIIERYTCGYNNWIIHIAYTESKDEFNAGLYDDKHNDYIWFNLNSINELEDFKNIIYNYTLRKYVLEKYQKYSSIARLLKERGYFVENIDILDFSISGKCEIIVEKSRIPMHIRINDISYTNENIYIALQNRYDIVYGLNYQSENDIDILCDNIEKFFEHINGRFGYFENGQYYNNSHVEEFIEGYSGKLEHVEDRSTDYQWIGYGNEDLTPQEEMEYIQKKEMYTINHYKGVEIYKKYSFYINYDEAYHLGGIVNEFEIEFIYNLNIDKDNCIINIEHNIIEYEGWNGHSWDVDFKNEISRNQNVETIKGSFTYCQKELEKFLDGLCEIKKSIMNKH